MKPMISVLVPSYNHEAYIIETLESIWKLGDWLHKIYLIDDASSDRTVVRVEEWKNRIGREKLEIHRKSHNRGVVDSVSLFLSLVESKYAILFSSDDLLVADGIIDALHELETSNELMFVIAGGHYLGENGNTSDCYNKTHSVLFTKKVDEFLPNYFTMLPSPILCQGTVFKVTALREVRGFDSDLVADDLQIFTKLFLRYSRRGIDFDFRPEVLACFYRQHEANSHRNLVRQIEADLAVFRRYAPNKLKNKVVSYRLAFYLLSAFRRRDIDTIKFLFTANLIPSPTMFLAGLVYHSIRKVVSSF